MMRFICVTFVALLLSGCGPRQLSTINVGPEPEAELARDEGAVLLEVIHAIGAGGPQLDRWTSVKVVSLIEPKKGEQPPVFSLERVVNLHSDSAIFAGVLPSGFYRLATFEGEWQAGSSMRPYGVLLPEKPTEFFVSAGKLNALGVMLQTSIGDWTWVYQREPRYDMPALVRELRPQLSALDAPLLLSQALVEKKKEPGSKIERAWPTTPVVMSAEGFAMRGAQFGRVYVRSNRQGDAEWKAAALETLQTITAVVPVSAGTAYALDAAGRLFNFNPATLESQEISTSVPPRVVSIGYANGTLFAVSERPQANGTVMLQLFAQQGNDWRTLGAPTPAPHSPHAMLFDETHFLFTTGGAPYDDVAQRLTRVALADGAHDVAPVPVQILRRMSDGRLVGAALPARAPKNFHASSDGGRTWQPLGRMNPAGWPSLDATGKLMMPSYRTFDGATSLYIGTTAATGINADPGVRFPARCVHFTETAYVDGRLMLFCGEQVFQHESAEYGWRKEALHELQSSLP